MGEAKRRAAAGIREGERPLPVDRLEFHDGETHDKLTRAMLDIAGQLDAARIKRTQPPELTAVELRDGSIRITVSAKGVISPSFHAPAGAWKLLTEEEASQPSKPLEPIDRAQYQKAIADHLEDAAHWYRDNRNRHEGVSSAIVVFDRSDESMRAMDLFCADRADEEMTALLDRWVEEGNAIAVVHLAVQPDPCLVFFADSIDDLCNNELPKFTHKVTKLSACALASPSKSPDMERVRETWFRLGGMPRANVTHRM